MNLAAYFQRIQYSGQPTADLHTLQRLHRQHLLNVPFENLDIPLGRPIRLEMARFYEKIVVRLRGGFC